MARKRWTSCERCSVDGSIGSSAVRSRRVRRTARSRHLFEDGLEQIDRHEHVRFDLVLALLFLYEQGADAQELPGFVDERGA